MGKIRNIIQPFKEKKIIYAKLYVNGSWFDELSTHLPNDLLYHLFKEAKDDIFFEKLEDLLKYVDYSIPFFPFALNFSLINDGVVELDNNFFKSKEKDANNIYRPFFYEFSGYCQSWNDFKKLLDHYYENKYFTCYLDFSEEFSYNQQQEVITVIEGNALFSASPIEERAGRLVIVPHAPPDSAFIPVLDDTIYSCRTIPINKSSEKDLKRKINNTLNQSFKPQNVTIYNVGQANNVTIELDKGKYIFFDIGLTKSKVERNQPEIKSAIREYSKVKPQIVVLSHWDIDHILGVPYADDSIYNALWIVPDLWGLMRYRSGRGLFKFKYISDSAKRLLKYLDFINRPNLIIIDENWSQDCIYISNNKELSIWTGKRQIEKGINDAKEPYSISIANNFGLIMTVRNKKGILLPGDCDYSVIPNAIWRDNYAYLIASHHCSKMSKIPLSKSSSNKKAILSYGVANSYKHPNLQHIRELVDIGYQINTTLGHRHIRCKLK